MDGERAVTERCAECGFEYDDATAAQAGSMIGSGVGEIVAVLRTDGLELAARLAPAVWSPLEYACHVRDVLLVQRERVLLARREDRPDCVPMGRDDRVDHDGYADQRPADVARQLADAGAMFLNVLSRLPESAWSRTVLYHYPDATERSLRWVAVHTAHDVRHHLLDIRRQLGNP